MNLLELSEQEIIRRNSLNELRAMGIEPYPAAEYVTNAFSTDIKQEFVDVENVEPRKVSVAGRIMSRRVMGKLPLLNYKIQKEESRFTSPVMTFAREKIKNCTQLFSNACSI